MKMKKEYHPLLYTLIGLEELIKISKRYEKESYPFWKFELLPHYLISAHQPPERQKLLKVFDSLIPGFYGWCYRFDFPPFKSLLNDYGIAIISKPNPILETTTGYIWILKNFSRKDFLEAGLDQEIVSLIRKATKNMLDKKPNFMNYKTVDHIIFSLNCGTFQHFKGGLYSHIEPLRDEFMGEFLNEFSPFRPL
ncbi:hypothetical protein H6776_00945 [Candidatus Nomurabacteria bacterium]|nr:hypothetical protein [Candidatus Nomurabacteria bacterium]